MTRALAVNVGANTNQPGFRGPVYPDGTFTYVPIPEASPTLPRDRFPVDESVPRYGDLELEFAVPERLRETPIHMDPEFPGVHGRERATYGDPFAVKAGPIAELGPGDWLLFYATFTLRPVGWDGPCSMQAPPASISADAHDDLAPRWGAYLFAGMRVETVIDTPSREDAASLVPTNAHLKRDPFDAQVVVRGDEESSGTFDRAVPLSGCDAGVEPNRIVTELSEDSGKGPWWRRPLRFDRSATTTLFEQLPLDR